VSVIRIMAMIEAESVTGSAKAVLEFAREASRFQAGFPEFDLSIVTFDRGRGENSLTKAIHDIGTPLDIVAERRRFDTQVIPQLRSVVEKRGVDLVWTNSVKSHFLTRLAGLNRSKSWVAFHHGYTSTDLKMKTYNHLDRWSLPTATRVLTSSSAFVKELQQRNVRPDHIHVQHMPIRPFAEASENRKAKLRKWLGLDDRARVLLSIGRLSREKGHTDLINAFSTIRKLAGDSSLRLVLVGEGPERSRIESLIRSLRLDDVVALVGQQDDINSYYGIADVFLLPSLSEGCPNVLLEAISAGVPVVATAVGGIPELVTNEQDALLVKKADPSALAFAAARLLNDGDLCARLVCCAREIVARKTPQAYFKSIASVFIQACANGN
jgi:glycosyltransferase involved in cell wall biosynthesis